MYLNPQDFVCLEATKPVVRNFRLRKDLQLQEGD
jgi:hypothetical protein